MKPDLETRLKDAYGSLDPSPGLGDGLFDAIEDSRISVPPEPRRWPPFVATAAGLLLVGLVVFVSRSVRDLGDFDGRMPADHPALSLDAERAADQKAYDAAKEGLAKDHAGEWVTIALGRVEKIGKSMEEVLPAGSAAQHRFVFKVGEEGDREEFASEWYGPRFSGPGLPIALDVEWTLGSHAGTVLMKDGKSTKPLGVPPFPRVPITMRAPTVAGSPGGPASRTLDVFIGTVGPPLMLMPEDWDALGLARFEVPGTMKVFDLPCRMATLDVSVAEVGAKGTLIASCPAFPREKLIDFARWRDAFWTKYWQLQQEVTKGHEGKCVVYAADRVVADGPDVNQALYAALGKPDGAYHRYVLALPRLAGLVFNAADFTEEKRLRMNGIDVTVRSNGNGQFLATKAIADRLHLEMAEDGKEVRIARGDGEPRLARGGYAWQGSVPDPAATDFASRIGGGVYYVDYEVDPVPETPRPPPK